MSVIAWLLLAEFFGDTFFHPCLAAAGLGDGASRGAAERRGVEDLDIALLLLCLVAPEARALFARGSAEERRRKLVPVQGVAGW